MIAVLKNEIRSYFTNMAAYVIGAFLLFFAGIYTMVYNLNYAVANYELVLSGMSFIFLVIVPILTMRVIAEERHQKTDQLLYSLPLSMGKIILGKYLAMLCIFLIPIAVICIYPIILSAFGNVSFPVAYTAILGFFLLGASLIAIGTFVSSVTESQAVAAGLCFVVMLLNYFLSSLSSFVSSSAISSVAALTICILLLSIVFYLLTKNSWVSTGIGVILEVITLIVYVADSSMLDGLFGTIMEELSLFEQFQVFVDGILDLTGVVYFLSVIVFFLFLSVQSMEKRRWGE